MRRIAWMFFVIGINFISTGIALASQLSRSAEQDAKVRLPWRPLEQASWTSDGWRYLAIEERSRVVTVVDFFGGNVRHRDVRSGCGAGQASAGVAVIGCPHDSDPGALPQLLKMRSLHLFSVPTPNPVGQVDLPYAQYKHEFQKIGRYWLTGPSDCEQAQPVICPDEYLNWHTGEFVQPQDEKHFNLDAPELRPLSTATHVSLRWRGNCSAIVYEIPNRPPLTITCLSHRGSGWFQAYRNPWIVWTTGGKVTAYNVNSRHRSSWKFRTRGDNVPIVKLVRDHLIVDSPVFHGSHVSRQLYAIRLTT